MKSWGIICYRHYWSSRCTKAEVRSFFFLSNWLLCIALFSMISSSCYNNNNTITTKSQLSNVTWKWTANYVVCMEHFSKSQCLESLALQEVLDNELKCTKKKKVFLFRKKLGRIFPPCLPPTFQAFGYEPIFLVDPFPTVPNLQQWMMHVLLFICLNSLWCFCHFGALPNIWICAIQKFQPCFCSLLPCVPAMK